MILAIDPGNEQSAYVVYDGSRIVDFGKVANAWLLDRVRTGHFDAAHLAIEMIASYGMPVGREVFETCLAIGRFVEAWERLERPHALVYRRDVKLHLCGQARAKDPNVRAALIDLFGGKDKAIGKKATPGPLYGVTADIWAALGVAITYTGSTKARAA